TLFASSGIIRTDDWERLEHTYHGSGCTLASAIAASLANGLSVSDSVLEAQDYTWHTLQAGFRPGMGQYIPNRLFWAKDGEDNEGEHEEKEVIIEQPEN
ncbi:MAG TPA: bifunctional hydroxymethylpyrimidine kinase/phosphomethylpyrimidine kinase, partial [Nitrosomonas sp.]|nr:bifunctional hydroxymethylpyrimidine kinase/phosphomethylpyrimidine kinase [Nitrosomonas sp.]